MNILIAPNAFKGSLDASVAAEAIRKGFLSSSLQCTCRCFPIGDGGDGTAELIVQVHDGITLSVPAFDALGRSISARLGIIADNNIAVIDLADSSGLRRLQPLEIDPLKATTFGTGMVLQAALEADVKKIILGVGGSATVDGGTGILRALGIDFFDSSDRRITQIFEFDRLHRVDVSGINPKLSECEITILCDVENCLLGSYGAARIFGPQKGADARSVEILEQALCQLCIVVKNQFGIDMNALKHGGAAGGVAAGLAALLRANLVNGVDFFLEMNGFGELLDNTDLVVTGEGAIDKQTLAGKGPYGVAMLAKRKGLPVIGMAGCIPVAYDESLANAFEFLMPIGNQPESLINAMLNTYTNLERTARMAGDALAVGMSFQSVDEVSAAK